MGEIVVASSEGETACLVSEDASMGVLRGVRGILFDLDGTVLDTRDLLLTTFRFAVREVLGTDLSDERLLAKVGQPLDTQMWDFTDDGTVHAELCRVYREYNAQVHDGLVKVFPGTREALTHLRAAGLPLGIVTSKRHALASRGLACFGLERFFDFLIGSDDWPEHKPDPGPVKHGCDRLGLSPDACVYVGDSPFDMRAGNEAGCVTIAALWGMFPESVLRGECPDRACGSITEIPGLLASPNCS